MISIKKITGIFIGLAIISISSYAQGPYNYQAPTGTNIYSTPGGGTKTVYATSWGTIPPGSDGIRVSATFSNLSNGTVLFVLNSPTYTLLQVIYYNQTLIVRRYLPNAPQSYDYILYDQMFDSQSSEWRVVLYFTGSFLWLESTATGSNQFYLSPVFFGINSTNYDFMEGYIYKANGMNVQFGPTQASENILVYAFNYQTIRNDIQTHFSSPAGFGETNISFNKSMEENIFSSAKDGIIQVWTDNGEKLDQVQIYDIQGRLVDAQTEINSSITQFPVRGKGVFIIKTIKENGTVDTRKTIVME